MRTRGHGQNFFKTVFSVVALSSARDLCGSACRHRRQIPIVYRWISSARPTCAAGALGTSGDSVSEIDCPAARAPS